MCWQRKFSFCSHFDFIFIIFPSKPLVIPILVIFVYVCVTIFVSVVGLGCLSVVWLWCFPLVCPWLCSIDPRIAVLCHG